MEKKDLYLPMTDSGWDDKNYTTWCDFKQALIEESADYAVKKVIEWIEENMYAAKFLAWDNAPCWGMSGKSIEHLKKLIEG